MGCCMLFVVTQVLSLDPLGEVTGRTLTLGEREDISRGIASGSSIREIAKGLQRPVSGAIFFQNE